MKHVPFIHEGLTGIAVQQTKNTTLLVHLSADIHTTHTVANHAVTQIYSDALLSGCKGYTREAFIDAINTLGGSISVEALHGRIHITLKGRSENSTKLLTLFGHMLNSPTFTVKELRRIQTQLHGALSEYRENARGIAHDTLVNALYKTSDRRFTDTPQTVIRALPKVTKRDLLELHTQVLATSWTCTIGGNAHTCDVLQHTLIKLRRIHPIQKSAHKQKHAQNAAFHTVLCTDIPSKQNIEFSIGAPLPLRVNDDEYAAFVFGLQVLGKWGGFTGRLMSTVREKEGLTYGIYAHLVSASMREFGYWRIMTFFAPDKATRGVRSTMREIQKIAEKGITSNELHRFKRIIQTQQTLIHDSLVRTVDYIHVQQLIGYDLEKMQELPQRTEELTKKQVNAALRQYLDPRKLVISAAGPTDRVKTQLQKL